LPNLVGKGLQYAQDSAQAAGFYSLRSHDALGRGRHQVLDRDWKVCFQQPGAGLIPTSAEVDFAAAKTEESCPAADSTPVAEGDAGAATMPRVIGQSAQVAQTALGNSASVTLVDGSGAGRAVLVASNWKVCRQSPAAGTPYAGVPVTLTVVKFAESC
jgi:hypothetical protein